MPHPLPDGPDAWVAFFAELAAILATLGGGWEYFRRRAKALTGAWRAGDAAMGERLKALDDQVKARMELDGQAQAAHLATVERQVNTRITDLAGNQVQALDALRSEVKNHEAKDDERIVALHGRLDTMMGSMARGDDLKRAEGKLDELIMHFATNQKGN